MDLKIEVSEELRQAWPQFRGAAVFATVKNSPYCEELWKRIGEFTELYRQKYTIDSIKEMPAIQATRQAYKKCGKDPSRYRPSSEAIIRKSKFPWFPERSVQFSGKRTKRSVQKKGCTQHL